MRTEKDLHPNDPGQVLRVYPQPNLQVALGWVVSSRFGVVVDLHTALEVSSQQFDQAIVSRVERKITLCYFVFEVIYLLLLHWIFKNK